MLKTLVKLSLSASISLIIVMLSGCGSGGISKQTEEQQIEYGIKEKGGLNLTKIFEGLNKKEQSGIQVNALLWRATLDIASTLPISEIDAFSGVIITDWYKAKPMANEQFKVSFFIDGAELRSDAITVQTYLQRRVGDSWVDAGRDDPLARRLEELVLTRARELRSTSLNESAK